MSELVVKGKIFFRGCFEDCCICIDNGKITQIKKILKGDKTLDFQNKLILPAGVDIHVHFREPGFTNKEDWYSGSIAAAFGGISCVFDMPNTIPQTTSIETINDKISIAENKSIVDFGVYAGVTNDNFRLMEKIGKKCSGFKLFLGSSTLSLSFDKKYLRETFGLADISNRIILVHAEDEECLINHKKVETNLSDHMRFRPSVCEELSINEVLHAAKGLSTRVHVCHVSSCEGLEMLKKKPNNVSFGITPHHCLLNVKNKIGSEGLYKVNPPIRTGFDKESLFSCVKSGCVDVLESDHAPHTREEKIGDFDVVPSGVPGVETIYPMFLYLAKKEIISFQRLISLMCNNPANLLGVSKGRFEPGYDADFIVVDIKKDYKIKSENLHSRCGWTPFEDWSAVFPESVYIRGEKVIDDSEIQVKQGFGRFTGGIKNA
jgi:dihydroorotase